MKQLQQHVRNACPFIAGFLLCALLVSLAINLAFWQGALYRNIDMLGDAEVALHKGK